MMNMDEELEAILRHLDLINETYKKAESEYLPKILESDQRSFLSDPSSSSIEEKRSSFSSSCPSQGQEGQYRIEEDSLDFPSVYHPSSLGREVQFKNNGYEPVRYFVNDPKVEEETQTFFPKPENISSVHNFKSMIQRTPIYYQVAKVGGSLYIWIGGSEETVPRFRTTQFREPHDLYTGLGQRNGYFYVGGQCESSYSSSTTLGAKLTRKLGKPVYISHNIETTNAELIHAIGKRLLEEIWTRPDKF